MQDQLPPQSKNLQDVTVLLNLFMDHWQGVFKKKLSQSDRAYVSELKEARNKWAHSEPISSDDADRYLDTAARLCRNIAAPEQAEAIRLLREELQQQVYSDRARNRTRYQVSIENQVQAGLLPWRDVIMPHPDVTTGKYQQAEFADLDQVRRCIGSKEYTDPSEFYRRTFITSGMRALLRIALERLNGQGGEPVLELQTNFGGGKTHSMLALYHLCSGQSLASLPGLDEVVQRGGHLLHPQGLPRCAGGHRLQPLQGHHLSRRHHRQHPLGWAGLSTRWTPVPMIWPRCSPPMRLA